MAKDVIEYTEGDGHTPLSRRRSWEERVAIVRQKLPLRSDGVRFGVTPEEFNKVNSKG